jgi:ribonuclease HII
MEQTLHAQGIGLICGVDEAGRGPLAGPVCAAAVILPEHWDLPGLNDSKKLTEKKRDVLFAQIQQQAMAYGIAFATVEEIEEINILSAALLAMNRAIAQLSPAPELALIDGNTTRDITIPAQSVVGGDGKCACIAAASVLAKVTRDHYMVEMSQQYPQYGFEKHKGYGTRAHYAALEEYGPSPIHRMSFLKKFYAKR